MNNDLSTTNTNIATVNAKVAKPQEEPEGSIALRTVCAAMSLVCLGVACHYTHTGQAITFIYIWVALVGAYVSYHLRYSKNILLVLVTVLGLIGVLSLFAYELYQQFMAPHFDWAPPFIHVLTGLLALHTFDLKTRTDLLTSGLIGLGLMCCSLILGRDLVLGLMVCIYVWLTATMLYYECAARTRASGRYTPAEPTTPARLALQREMRGSAIIPISLVPILGLFFFFCLPRVSSIFDLVVDQVTRIMNPIPVPIPGGSGVGIIVGAGGVATPGTIVTGGPGGAGAPGTGAGYGNGTGAGYGNGTGSGPGGGPGGAGSGPGGVGGGNGPGVAAGDGTDTTGGAAPGGGSKSGPPVPKPPELQPPPDGELVFRDKQNAKFDDELLLTITAPGDYFLKRIVLDKYDGHKWTISKSGMTSKCRKVNGGVYQELGGVPSLFMPSTLKYTDVMQEYSVKSNLGHIIPSVPMAQKIDFPIEPVIVDDNGIIKSDAMIKAGTTFRVLSQVPTYNLEELRSEPITSSEHEKSLRKEYDRFLQVPKDLPAEVKDLSRTVAGTDGNWFVKAERICKFLRANYKYSNDGDDVPKDRDLVDTFLFSNSKAGACGPFASAMAVMCRCAGLPARVVGGFAPGDYNGMTGAREIHAKHGHAWAEIYIPHSGWVPFDATPTGVLPVPPEEDHSFLATVNRNLQQLQTILNPPRVTKNQPSSPDTLATNGTARPPINLGGAPPIPAPPLPAPGGTNNAKPNEPKITPKLPSLPDVKGMVKNPFTWWLHGLVALALIPATFLLAQAIRISWLKFQSRTRVDKNAKPSTVAYLRVVDDLKRFKISRSPSDTADDFSIRFLTAVDGGLPVHPELPTLLQQFMSVYADDRFGNPADSHERSKRLFDISDQIRTLAKSRHHDKITVELLQKSRSG